jgi:hypothetical protein
MGGTGDLSFIGTTTTASDTFNDSPTFFFNSQRWNGSANSTHFQGAIKGHTRSITNGDGYLGIGANASANHLNIDASTGNIGIGTTAPEANTRLHVKGLNSANLIIEAPTDNASLTIQAGSSDAGAEESVISFVQNTDFKWQLGNITNNDFRLYNYVTSSAAITVATATGAAQFGYAGAATQQADSQALSITTPASGGGQGIALKRLDSNSDQQLGEISFSNNTQDGLGGMRMKTSGAVNTTQLDFDIASGGAISTPLKLDNGGVTVTGNHTQNGARVQMQSFDVFASSTSSRRVRVTLGNYESCYVRLMVQRTNGGDSIAYWEGIINNNNNGNFVTQLHSKSANPTFTFDYTTTSVFQWTFDASLSSGDGVIYVQDIRGGASISLLAT